MQQRRIAAGIPRSGNISRSLARSEMPRPMSQMGGRFYPARSPPFVGVYGADIATLGASTECLGIIPESQVNELGGVTGTRLAGFDSFLEVAERGRSLCKAMPKVQCEICMCVSLYRAFAGTGPTAAPSLGFTACSVGTSDSLPSAESPQAPFMPTGRRGTGEIRERADVVICCNEWAARVGGQEWVERAHLGIHHLRRDRSAVALHSDGFSIASDWRWARIRTREGRDRSRDGRPRWMWLTVKIWSIAVSFAVEREQGRRGSIFPPSTGAGGHRQDSGGVRNELTRPSPAGTFLVRQRVPVASRRADPQFRDSGPELAATALTRGRPVESQWVGERRGLVCLA